MKISLIIIGSEILEGKVQDINTLNLSKFLKSQSYELEQVLTVSDNASQILNALHFMSSSELVVISGGMGPTPDDITKATISKFLDCDLIQNTDSISVATSNYENQGRSLPLNHPYQFIPQVSKALFNPQGYAPGLIFKQNKSTFIAFPGVPREFQSMMKLHLPCLLQKKEEAIFDYIIRTKGIGEEAIFEKLDPLLWKKLSEFGTVASLPYLYGVDVTVRLRAINAEEMSLKKEALTNFIFSHPLKDYIWLLGSQTLEECIIQKAKSMGVRFGFAESCSGGLCSDKITNVNGSSSVFYGSVVCYSSEIKTKLLGVGEKVIDEFDVVSAPVALQMAQGLRKLYPIDIAVSLTGHAGPHDNEVQIPTGTVYIGVSSPLGDFTYQFLFKGDRLRLKENFYQVALFQLLETLEKLALVDMSNKPR